MHLRVSGTVTGAAAGAVVCDTGPVASGGTFLLEAALAAFETPTNGRGLVVEHRDAANGATVATLAGCPTSSSVSVRVLRVRLGAGERVRVVAGAAAAAAAVYVAAVTLYAVPAA